MLKKNRVHIHVEKNQHETFIFCLKKNYSFLFNSNPNLYIKKYVNNFMEYVKKITDIIGFLVSFSGKSSKHHCYLCCTVYDMTNIDVITMFT